MKRNITVLALAALGCSPQASRFKTSLQPPNADTSLKLAPPDSVPHFVQSPSAAQGEKSVRQFFAHLSLGDLSRISRVLAPGAEVTPAQHSSSQPALPILKELLGSLVTGSPGTAPLTLGDLQFVSVQHGSSETEVVVLVGAGGDLTGEWQFSLTQQERHAHISRIVLPKPH